MQRLYSAGGIVFRQNGDRVEWLIRRPSPNPGFKGHLGWNLPRGLLDEGETSVQAALREVREEAGVNAKIIEKLSPLKLFYINDQKEKTLKTVVFFLMEWESDIPEGFCWETAEIRWVEFSLGLEMLAHDNEKKLLTEAQNALIEHLQKTS